MKYKYLLFFLFVSFGVIFNVSAVEGMELCDEDRVRQAFQIVGYILFVAKILVPLLLIAMGTMDFAKAIFTNDDKEARDAGRRFITRLVIAAIIFILPTFLDFAFSLVDGTNEVSGDYNGCTQCLFHPFDDDKCEFGSIIDD